MGILYLGWFFCYLIFMRKMMIPGTSGMFKFLGMNIDQGAGFVLVLVFSTSMTDTGAYFLGKIFGKHKLCPHLSPGKTVEGAIGGMVGALAGAFLIGLPLKLMPTDIMNIGALCGIFAQLGDLWESVLKRDVHVKDSGTAIAGHGGIMDRIDSILFTTPVVYFYIKYFLL
jgi:phosphatidate cytidylyltransferase